MNSPRRPGVPRAAWLLFIPVIALLSSVYLPFVNTADLWLGMPALIVWTSLWVLLITPALLLVERSTAHHGEDTAPHGHETEHETGR